MNACLESDRIHSGSNSQRLHCIVDAMLCYHCIILAISCFAYLTTNKHAMLYVEQGTLPPPPACHAHAMCCAMVDKTKQPNNQTGMYVCNAKRTSTTENKRKEICFAQHT